PIGGLAILAVEGRVADAEPVLGHAGLDQPMRGVLLGCATRGAPVAVGDVTVRVEVGHPVMALDEQSGGYVYRRQGAPPSLDVGGGTDEEGRRRIERCRRRAVPRPLVAEARRDAHAVEL